MVSFPRETVFPVFPQPIPIGQLFKRRIYIKKTVINGLFIIIANDLMQSKPVNHLFKQVGQLL